MQVVESEPQNTKRYWTEENENKGSGRFCKREGPVGWCSSLSPSPRRWCDGSEMKERLWRRSDPSKARDQNGGPDTAGDVKIHTHTVRFTLCTWLLLEVLLKVTLRSILFGFSHSLLKLTIWAQPLSVLTALKGSLTSSVLLAWMGSGALAKVAIFCFRGKSVLKSFKKNKYFQIPVGALIFLHFSPKSPFISYFRHQNCPSPSLGYLVCQIESLQSSSCPSKTLPIDFLFF